MILLNDVRFPLFSLNRLLHTVENILRRSAAHTEASKPAIPIILIGYRETGVLISTFGSCGVLRIRCQSTSDAANEVHLIVVSLGVNSPHGIRTLRILTQIGNALMRRGRVHSIILFDVCSSTNLLIQEYARKRWRNLRVLDDVDLLIELRLLLLQKLLQVSTLVKLAKLLHQLQLVHLMLLLEQMLL